METYHITPAIYEAIAESAQARPDASWDCIEMLDGCAVVFACRNGKPVNVEVLDGDDNPLPHDYSADQLSRVCA